MSSEKYQRPKDFPEWVSSAEDEALVVEALALDSSIRFLLNSKANCEKYLETKRKVAPQTGKC